MTTQRVKIFSLFERFWHWTQMLLIVVLLITGFDEVDLSDAEEAYLRQDQPADIR